MKLEAGCFWVNATAKPPIYNMALLKKSTVPARAWPDVSFDMDKYEPFVTVILSVEDFLLFHDDGRALRQALTAISKLDGLSTGDIFHYDAGI